jgi:hypothetical protein
MELHTLLQMFARLQNVELEWLVITGKIIGNEGKIVFGPQKK